MGRTEPDYMGNLGFVYTSLFVSTDVLSWERVLPILVRRWQFETVFRSEVMSLFKNKPITMLLVHWWTIFIRSSKKYPLATFDRNTVSNWFRSNEDGAELFSMIVRNIFQCWHSHRVFTLMWNTFPVPISVITEARDWSNQRKMAIPTNQELYLS